MPGSEICWLSARLRPLSRQAGTAAPAIIDSEPDQIFCQAVSIRDHGGVERAFSDIRHGAEIGVEILYSG